MGKEERQARKAARKADKMQRKDQLGRLIKAIKSSDISFKPDGDSDVPFIDVFKEIWEILDPALKYAIAMKKTNAETDAALQKVWDAGNALATEQTEELQQAFIDKFKGIWDTIEGILNVVEQIPLLPDKVADVIEDLIEIGEWISDGGALPVEAGS